MKMSDKTHKKMTILNRACEQVPGFKDFYNRIRRRIRVSGKSDSTLSCYSRCLAQLALHYNCLPTQLRPEQVETYLEGLLQKGHCPSKSHFKIMVYGMRFACRTEGLPYSRFSLPRLKHEKRLPVVLSREEVRRIFGAARQFKHRLLLGLLYGCGLRCMEVRSIRLGDMDLDRRMLHVRQGKGRKDRYVPLGEMLCRGIRKYLCEEQPSVWLFNGRAGRKQVKRKATIRRRSGPGTDQVTGEAGWDGDGRGPPAARKQGPGGLF
jgi:integrase/recombinase XerD